MNTKSLFFFLILSAVVLSADTAVTKKSEIIDANHYYSQQNKQKTYDITGLFKDKPLTILLMPPEAKAYDNPITLTVKIGSKSKQCKYRSYEDICVIEQTQSQAGSLGIQCQKLPCDVKWKLYQTQAKQLVNSQKVQALYKLPENVNRVGITLHCESIRQQLEKQDRLILAFSNIQFVTISADPNSVTMVFNQVKSGYVYFVVNPKFKNCLKMRISNGPKVLPAQRFNDFLLANMTVTYGLQNIPDNKNFVIEMGFHPIFSQQIQKQIFVTITGEKDGNKKQIRRNKISFNPTYKFFDFSYGVPKINTSQYKNLKLELESQNSILLTELLLKKTQVFEVQATQFNYFDLKKGEKLQYRLVQQKKAEDGDVVSFFPSEKDSLKLSKQRCNVKQGCQFEIQALKDISGSVYLGVASGQTKQVVILDFGKDQTFTHRIKQLEEVYIKKKFELNKPVQVAINTPNVMVYLSNIKKCPMPSRECYQKVGNINKHFFYVPEKQQQTDVMFKVQALDDCQFTITLLPQDTEYVTLVDSQPFVYMFSPEQTSLKFRFIRKEKVDVNFNLIAPLHALDLIVQNGKKLPADQDATISVEGFLEFKAENSPKNQFSILVRRRQDQGKSKKFIHFTLIASTKGKHIRLESGVTHYETLTKSDSNNAEYIFEFDPDQDFFLNFYSHNTKQQNVDIKLTLRALTTNDKSSKKTKLTIDKSSDALDLSQVSKQLCADVDDDSNCQIAFTLQNQMDFEVDIAITLMQQHSILELKDGLWQSFSLNSVAKTTHFYFSPKNKKNDVQILFKTTDPAIRLKYRLYYTGGDQIDPSSWPFPAEQITAQNLLQQKKHKPVNHFSISKSRLNQCWPDCTLLVSIIDLQKKDNQGSFSLLASNSILQIPEKQKIDITLASQQTKSYLVDLKYALEIEQNIYFYIYHSIGLTSIYANVYSEKNDRVPDQQAFDFDLNTQRQVKISIQSIKDIIKAQQMDDHLNIYLYIIVQSLTDSKVSIQFTFNEIDKPNEKLISMDTFQHLLMKQNDSKIYYAPIYQPYQVKVIREKGFPMISSLVCKKQLEQCLTQVRASSQKGVQLLTKVAAYTATPCENCFYIFKISTEKDPADLTIHLQSKSSQIELIENKAVYDFTENKQSNNYVFYAIRGQQIYLNIHVTEGQIQAEASDMNTLSMKKTGKNIISFVIPGESTAIRNKKQQNKKLSKEQKQQIQKQQLAIKSLSSLKQKNPGFSQAIMSAFGLSDKFVEFRVSIKSTDVSKPSVYTISYSSGQRQFQLQDGLITDYVLQPKKQVTFYYSAKEAYHMYLTMSMEKSSYLKDLKINLKYCEPKNKIIDDDCWVDYKTDSPTVKDKVPHPTLVYLLVNKNYIAITLTYDGDHSQKVSLGINHQEIMILPFDVQFPFILHSNQSLDFLVELSNPGYIQIITRKCDESNPTFSYTFDYESFQKGQFTYQSQLGANPKSRFMSKVKPGTLYMQMKTPQNQNSIVSVLVRYSEKKIFTPEILPGNKGNVDYSIVDSTSAELTVRPPTCPDSICPKFKYFIMSAAKMRDLYSQLVCPSNFFTNTELVVGEPVKLTQVQPKQNKDGSLTFPIQLLDQISYVGIKATNGKDKQVFYKPLEVATFWGQLSRTSHSHKLTIASIFICIIVGIVVCVRRSARRGYKPINDEI